MRNAKLSKLWAVVMCVSVADVPASAQTPVKPPDRHVPLPIGAIQDWVGNKDFTRKELTHHPDGSTVLRTSIGTTGALTNCQIEMPRQASDTDRRVCNLLVQRAHFRLASDQNGNPVIGTYMFQLDWIAPHIRLKGVTFLPAQPAYNAFSQAPVTTHAHANSADPHGPVPIGAFKDWIRDSDFQPAEIAHPLSEYTYLDLTVSAAGAPVACEVTFLTARKDTDQAVCDLLIKRASFKPATDAEGNAKIGTYGFTVIWQSGRVWLVKSTPFPGIARPKGPISNWITWDGIPAELLKRHASGIVFFRISVGIDGHPTDCMITKSSQDTELDADTCKLLMRRARFFPPTDSFGNPAPGAYSSSVRWQVPSD